MSALLQNFTTAALALMADELSGLTPEEAVFVDRAQRQGADVCLVFSPGAQTIIGALHPLEPDADVLELFRINLPATGGSN